MFKSIEEYKKEARLKRDLKSGKTSITEYISKCINTKLEEAVDKFIPLILESLVSKIIQAESFTKTVTDHVINKIQAEVFSSIKTPEDGKPGMPGTDGEPGKDYILTETDIKTIASSIEVPIVERVTEKIIEKTEVIKEQPIITNEIREVAKQIEGKEIVDKINLLPIESEFQIDASHLKNWKEKDKRVGAKMGGIARGGLGLIWNTELEGLVNSSNTIFTIPSALPSPVDSKYIVSVRGVLKTADAGDFTVSNSNRTVTFVSAPPTGSDSPRIILYQSH